MKTVNNFSFTLKARLVEDDETGYFSATCPEFPEAFVQGKTEGEDLKNLVELIPYVLFRR